MRARTPQAPAARDDVDPNAFVTAENTCHFHPDFRMGVVGILVLTRPSELRDPGVYICGPDRQWAKGYEFSDLPANEWVQLTGLYGEVLPVQVMVVGPGCVLARFLGAGGHSVSPGQWNSGDGQSEALQTAAAQRRLDVARNEDEMIRNAIGNIRA